MPGGHEHGLRGRKGKNGGQELGPLAGLEGIWEGEKGTDTAPDDDRIGKEISRYRERMTFAPTGLVENHEQQLHGRRYATTAWGLGEDDPFHHTDENTLTRIV